MRTILPRWIHFCTFPFSVSSSAPPVCTDFINLGERKFPQSLDPVRWYSSQQYNVSFTTPRCRATSIAETQG